MIDNRHIVLDTGTTTISIDLITGTAVKTAKDRLMWCHPYSWMNHRVPFYFGSRPSSYLYSVGLAFPCTSDGKAVSTPAIAFVPSMVGTQFDGGIWVYASLKGVTAYRVE